MKKNIILVITLIVTAFGIISYLNFRSENNELEEKIISSETANENLRTEIKDLNEKLDLITEKAQTYECRYTETYRYVDKYAYNGAVPELKFIVVDKYQEFTPIIFSLDTNRFKINFEKNQTYEFTFLSSMIGEVEGTRNIIDIKKTDKMALEQTQESCGPQTKVIEN